MKVRRSIIFSGMRYRIGMNVELKHLLQHTTRKSNSSTPHASAAPTGEHPLHVNAVYFHTRANTTVGSTLASRLIGALAQWHAHAHNTARETVETTAPVGACQQPRGRATARRHGCCTDQQAPPATTAGRTQRVPEVTAGTGGAANSSSS